MIIVEIEFGSPAYDEMIYLRQEVLWKPLGLDFSIRKIEEEYTDTHFGVYIDSMELIAGLSINIQQEIASIYQVIVKQSFQHSGIGKLILGYAMEWLTSKGVKTIVLDAKAEAVDFYKKLGFDKFGRPFYAANVKHYHMEKQLE